MIAVRLASRDNLPGEFYSRCKTIERFADFTAETRIIPVLMGHGTPSAPSLLAEQRTGGSEIFTA